MANTVVQEGFTVKKTAEQKNVPHLQGEMFPESLDEGDFKG